MGMLQARNISINTAQKVFQVLVRYLSCMLRAMRPKTQANEWGAQLYS